MAQREDELALGYVDRYDDFLRVFPDTGGCADAKIPDSVIKKAQVVISDKSQSNYVGEAYFLMGQASYFKCDFYNAVEYFDYVYHNYPKETALGIKARSWKARTLMLSGEEDFAGRLLDSTIKLNDTLKKPDPIAYETKLLWSVNDGEYADAEKMAQKALDAGLSKRQEWRIRFLLAQLQEINKKTNEAYTNYTKIERSNAPFEMAFNASLNKIRIADAADGRKVDRTTRMLQLLKDDKNRDFQDQIYYQIAQLKQAEKKYTEAEKYYNLSIKAGTKNQVQKGLAYLRLAELSISHNSDYVAAGGYYEDALTNLPQTYPGYVLIRKKAQNLQFISGKTSIISREDTLQMLAKMPEAERISKIAQMADSQVKKEQIQNTGVFSGYAEPATMENPQTQVTTVGAFYFDNTNAVSQGFSSFKRRWGDRKLADNWRSSTKGQAELVPTAAIAPDPDKMSSAMLPPGVLPNSQSVDQLKAGYSKDLPTSPALVEQSNTRIIGALLDLANYYRDELLDTAETIKTYQTLLQRFPNYADKPSVYYNLYRLNQEKAPAKSASYRDSLTKLFPQSSYTKAINDPEYFNKMSQASAGIIQAYEKVYDVYAKLDYASTVQQADNFSGQMRGTVFNPQVAYLKAIATGHLQKLDVFEKALKDIVAAYPSDRLVVPLIKQHLNYIDSNRVAMAKRPVALLDRDPNEPPFFEQEEAVFATENQQLAVTKPVTPAKQSAPVTPQPEKTAAKPAQENPVVKTAPEKPAETEVNNTPFSLAESTNYYFVINVASASVNLSSSRFGIGQFNRANFQGDNIKHQLKTVGGTNQLIYVGRFFSLDAVKDYARNIAPLIPEIMKVPKEQYTFFVITQENLDKLADKNLLQQYLGFYEKFILK